jgi:pilus assembly protein Flp/PilA
MLKIFRRLMKDESGVTAIEYGLIASVIIVAIAGILITVGSSLTNTFQNVSNSL